MSAALRDKWLKEFNAGGDGATFKYVSSDTAFCRACEKTFRAKQKSELAQHVRGDRHKSNLALKKKRTVTQATMGDFGGGKRHKCDVVAQELCQAMLAAGIPWSKLENPALRSFLEKHITLQIPDESWIRKHYLDKCYDEALAGIRADLGQQPIWLSVDETTDSAGRYVANIIAGRLSKEGYFRPHLVQCMFLEKTNSGEIVRAVNDTLRYLWPDFKPECLKVLVSDAAAYMIKAGHALKELFPDLLHVTCVAHALHRVCETVREMFKDVNDLIATTKKAFVKAPSRVVLWKEQQPNLSLPPEPILTRWGTWIDAALFYAEHFEAIKDIVDQLNDDAMAIRSAKDLFGKADIKLSLVFLNAHVSFIPKILKQLEEAGMELAKAFQLLDQAKEELEKIRGCRKEILLTKFKAVLQRNPDIGVLRTVALILDGDLHGSEVGVPAGVKLADIPLLRYCPIVSVDVERSFSVYRNVLTDRRHRLTKENITKIMISNTYFNHS
uniref:transcription factor 19 isoform X1 n=1 Tax=Myxine glutinosa TaxID=7769 RepID=UPI00358E2E52